MTMQALCEVQELSALLALPFQAALRLYQASDPAPHPASECVLVRRHDGTIGELEVIL